MPSFICNICGTPNDVTEIARESASCVCGSNVRMRALIHLLSIELFGQSLPLPEFPQLKRLRAIGMTDDPSYAGLLAEKFDYTNTYYDCEPRMDLTEHHPDLREAFDFILSADVFEHIAPPLDRALNEACELLKPTGFIVATVPCPGTESLEHFPELYQFRVVPLGDTTVLINRRHDGTLEITEKLLFHGGDALEMRQMSPTQLREKLLAGGFRQVEFLNENLPQIGFRFDEDGVSQPLVARKQKFEINGTVLNEFIDYWRATQERKDFLEKQTVMASSSRWLRLGRAIGIGPRLL